MVYSYNTLATYDKVVRVINSCSTIAQLIVAKKYATLFIQSVPTHQKSVFIRAINRIINRRKSWILLDGDI